MAIQLLGADGSSVNSVDPIFKAQRSTMRPVDSLAWNSLSLKSGLITGAAGSSPLFTMRYTGANNLMLRRLGVGWVTTTAFTTAQLMDFGVTVARNFTAPDSGGTVVTLPGTTTNKHRTTLAEPTAMDIHMATTGALVGGTRTLDAYPLSQTAVFCAAVGATLQPTPNNLFEHDTGDYPIILAANEGIVVSNMTAMGSAGVGYLYINAEFAETAAAVF